MSISEIRRTAKLLQRHEKTITRLREEAGAGPADDADHDAEQHKAHHVKKHRHGNGIHGTDEEQHERDAKA